MGVSVGSEDLYRVSESGVRNKAGLGKDADEIVKFINETRDFLGTVGLGDVLVGHVDTWSAWANSSNEAGMVVPIPSPNSLLSLSVYYAIRNVSLKYFANSHKK